MRSLRNAPKGAAERITRSRAVCSMVVFFFDSACDRDRIEQVEISLLDSGRVAWRLFELERALWKVYGLGTRQRIRLLNGCAQRALAIVRGAGAVAGVRIEEVLLRLDVKFSSIGGRCGKRRRDRYQ